MTPTTGNGPAPDQFVAPPPRTTPRRLWQAPVDFFYAALVRWDARQLGAFLEAAVDGCVAALPPVDAVFDGRAWNAARVPVHTPALELCETARVGATLARAAAAHANDAAALALITASMRLVVVAAFFRDYRFRALVMRQDARTHGVMRTQPPARTDVWRFCANGAGACIEDYLAAMAAPVADEEDAAVDDEEDTVEGRARRTLALAHDFASWWVNLE